MHNIPDNKKAKGTLQYDSDCEQQELPSGQSKSKDTDKTDESEEIEMEKEDKNT